MRWCLKLSSQHSTAPSSLGAWRWRSRLRSGLDQNIARQKGASAYIGDGLNYWPAVHRFDAAHLCRVALEKGSAGACYHAIADEGVLIRDMAEVIGWRLNLPVVAKSKHEATGHFWLDGALPCHR